MKQEIVNFPKRLKEIRKNTHHSKSNCSKVLDIPVDQYEGYENDEGLITLPEIELLAACFGVPITSFFQADPPELPYQPRMNKGTKSKFIEISNKITQVKIIHKMSLQDMSIEELSLRSGISPEYLQNYLSGKSPVPVKDLLRVTESLDQPISDYYSDAFQERGVNLKEPDHLSQQDKDPTEEELKAILEGEDTPVQLAQAISQLPIRDQADIAKSILQKLKT